MKKRRFLQLVKEEIEFAKKSKGKRFYLNGKCAKCGNWWFDNCMAHHPRNDIMSEDRRGNLFCEDFKPSGVEMLKKGTRSFIGKAKKYFKEC